MHRAPMLMMTLLATTSACSGRARSPDEYRDDTQALLESRRPQIKACYDTALRTYPTSEGSVTVRFTVEPDTGHVRSPRVEERKSTAPPALRECVLRALDGLVLSPADLQEGQAAFSWEFNAAPPRPAT